MVLTAFRYLDLAGSMLQQGKLSPERAAECWIMIDSADYSLRYAATGVGGEIASRRFNAPTTPTPAPRGLTFGHEKGAAQVWAAPFSCRLRLRRAGTWHSDRGLAGDLIDLPGVAIDSQALS